jgi:GNAT superfamily N-acetyltransferase
MEQPGDHGLTFRQDYFSDPAGWTALVDLLQDIFSIDVGLLDRLGGPDPSSMPFAYFDDAGACVANFSAFSMPVIINGRERRAAGFQSGAVRPEWRQRGLYRELMRKAFAWTEEQGFELGLLLTSKPGLYEPYGFRTIPQHFFVGEPPAAIAKTNSGTSLSLPRDGAIVRSMLRERTAVSWRFAVMQQAEMFLLNACFDPNIRLSAIGDDQIVAAWKLEENCLKLLDVVGRDMPTLASIIADLGIEPDRVEVYFPTDRLDWEGDARLLGGSTVLMMRGGKANEMSAPVILSPMAEF